MPKPRKNKKLPTGRKKSTQKTQLVRRRIAPGSPSVAVTRTDPLLQAYLREVQTHPLLTREEEYALAVRFYENKDREAFQKLVTSNLRFVVKIAYEYVHYRLKLLDLIQEGNVGLVKAVQEFDPYKDVRLTTYAVWWIRSFIQDAILKNHSLVKMGTTQAQKKLFYRLRSEERRLEAEGSSPYQNVKLLAKALDVRERDVQEMTQRLSGADLSLNTPIKSDDEQEHIQNIVDHSDPTDVALAELEQKDIFRKILRKFADTLDGREKVIFSERLISENPVTLQEIGDRYGVSKERARQIEEALKERLKQYVKDNYPDYDLLTER